MNQRIDSESDVSRFVNFERRRFHVSTSESISGSPFAVTVVEFAGFVSKRCGAPQWVTESEEVTEKWFAVLLPGN